jgi:hypothetical protein
VRHRVGIPVAVNDIEESRFALQQSVKQNAAPLIDEYRNMKNAAGSEDSTWIHSN